MSLKQRITDAMKDAMRSKQKERLGTIRLITSAIKQQEVDNKIENLDDTAVLAVLEKMIKQRKDAIAQFQKADRNDLADKESLEVDVIQEFMPEQLSVEEVSALVKDTVAKHNASSIKDMGKVMADLKPLMQGKADMGIVSKMLKDILSAS